MNITLHFTASKSKYYPGIVRLGKKFDSVTTESGKTTAVFTFEEIVEKWDEFSVYYWTIIKWKGCTVEFDGQRYNSHSDKTNIFYSIQSMHDDVLHKLRAQIAKQAKQVIKGSKTSVIKKDRLSSMSNEEIDVYIDVMLNSKSEDQ